MTYKPDVATTLVDRLSNLILLGEVITEEILQEQFVISKILCGYLSDGSTQSLSEELNEPIE